MDVMPAKPDLPEDRAADQPTDRPVNRVWMIKNVPELVRAKAVEAATRNGETQGEFVTRALVELIKERPSRDLVPTQADAPPTAPPATTVVPHSTLNLTSLLPVEELRALVALASEVNGGFPPRSVTRRVNRAIRARLDEVLK